MNIIFWTYKADLQQWQWAGEIDGLTNHSVEDKAAQTFDYHYSDHPVTQEVDVVIDHNETQVNFNLPQSFPNLPVINTNGTQTEFQCVFL